MNCILANIELPEGFTARPLVRSDIDDVYAVAEAYDIEMLGEPDLEKADVEVYWKMPNFHLDTDSLGVFDGSRLTAFTEVLMGKYVDLCVHADYRGRGIGTALGRWSEDRLRDMGSAKAIQSAPVTDEAALRNFADRGYELGWTSWALALRSDVAIPQRELAEGYAVRPFIPGIEDEAVYEVVQTAFGEWPDRDRTPYEDWRAVVFEREGFTPDNMLVAAKGDDIVGVCYVVDGDRAGWVNSLAVDKAHRNRASPRSCWRGPSKALVHADSSAPNSRRIRAPARLVFTKTSECMSHRPMRTGHSNSEALISPDGR